MAIIHVLSLREVHLMATLNVLISFHETPVSNVEMCQCQPGRAAPLDSFSLGFKDLLDRDYLGGEGIT